MTFRKLEHLSPSRKPKKNSRSAVMKKRSTFVGHIFGLTSSRCTRTVMRRRYRYAGHVHVQTNKHHSTTFTRRYKNRLGFAVVRSQTARTKTLMTNLRRGHCAAGTPLFRPPQRFAPYPSSLFRSSDRSLLYTTCIMCGL